MCHKRRKKKKIYPFFTNLWLVFHECTNSKGIFFFFFFFFFFLDIYIYIYIKQHIIYLIQYMISVFIFIHNKISFL
ncbi:hypothetical protein PFMALIP_01276 [Plasmodium falciparum MaliPS096_E11]|uniref:Uncharacterized protein n=1 Tax=Plasmodium falciparum MaliPS096_E11 TaxID=1036727 RepID=A0A024WUA9_PLAFA|nr:hypothetical protein PFMALIP_01276 [Plasmodium falciparum MaliPS096_E11]